MIEKIQSTMPTNILTKIGLELGNNELTFHLEGSIFHGYFCIRAN
jgi:hypothetical protein